MKEHDQRSREIIRFLQEREKELACLYKIEEVTNRPDAGLESVCKTAIKVIPPGWQYPDICVVRITVDGTVYKSKGFKETRWVQCADMVAQNRPLGQICVYYTEERPEADDGPFLKEETRLLKTIAQRIGQFVTLKQVDDVARQHETAGEYLDNGVSAAWRVLMNLVRATDKNLFLTICQKMLNQLAWAGVEEIEEILKTRGMGRVDLEEEALLDENRPHPTMIAPLAEDIGDRVLEIAGRNLPENQILAMIQKWMQEDKLAFLFHVINRDSSLGDLDDTLERYKRVASGARDLGTSTRIGIRVELIRRLLSEQLQYINIAKKYFSIDDFTEILKRLVHSRASHGKLGGKSAGLLLAAQIISESAEDHPDLRNIKIPRTWYIASDAVLEFLSYNNLGEVVEQKYKDIGRVRLEYPHVIQSFKNCRFPPELVRGLSMVLDEFQDRPLIVRSSSLLEDRVGASFSSKYRSIFISNQGTKKQRLEALTGAIAEVYASTFGPDPIEYRAERGLIDFAEEMGILIQEVVGTKVGDYFLPSFAGVAFSRNDFRWSPRIERKDGIVRLVPGLGTRAVDRVANDYPILIAPGQPNLRVNMSTDEIVRYSPVKADVINLKTNAFETVDVRELLRKAGNEIPGIEQMISMYDGEQTRQIMGIGVDYERDDLVVTFDGLVGNTKFVSQMRSALSVLERELQTPVDIEFAHDGKYLYLLQCRAQSYSEDSAPSPIPKDVPERDILFTANKYISNGRIPDITHIVFVDPDGYSNLTDRSDLVEVGRAVSKLNNLLPKRQFILMGPGRWGSRGDIKLGVNVTYSDINNTAVLVEIARRKGEYTPELSFGTHFFQDLVEAGIRYLPLYPDDEGMVFNDRFLRSSANILEDLAPEFEGISETVRLIDVAKASDGRVLRILMNADLNEAIGIFADPSERLSTTPEVGVASQRPVDTYWAWRFQMAEHIARQIDPDRFGVKAIYVFGSTKNATAGPQSDIDLLVHFQGTDNQRRNLEIWLEGWSLSLAQVNYLRTGYLTDGLLDVHIITDEDIVNKTSYASKIGAVTDPARRLSLGERK
ncbi:MAG: PEP/pyruvate-binding domain-containing protein [Candidatus Eisenbacteria bacterium]